MKKFFHNPNLSFGSNALLPIYFFCNAYFLPLFFCAGWRDFSTLNFFMFSFKMANFRKNSECPSSQELLRFQKSESSRGCRKIKKHITECEFCAAELGFYARFPQSEETSFIQPPSEIPAPLYELAEAILSKKYLDYSMLNKLLGENESVKV
jgi:hypothetical protein